MWRIVFTKQAAKDAKHLKEAGLDRKAKALFDVMRNDPFATPPAYEALVGSLAGMYSRRINIKHRLVYEVLASEADIVEATAGAKAEAETEGHEGVIKVLRMWTHYDKIR